MSEYSYIYEYLCWYYVCKKIVSFHILFRDENGSFQTVQYNCTNCSRPAQKRTVKGVHQFYIRPNSHSLFHHQIGASAGPTSGSVGGHPHEGGAVRPCLELAKHGTAGADLPPRPGPGKDDEGGWSLAMAWLDPIHLDRNSEEIPLNSSSGVSFR
jgi:hypothetical protein